MHVHISLGFIENPKTISYEVQFETQMQLYRQVSHRFPNGDFIPQTRGAVDSGRVDTAGDPIMIAQRAKWREDNILRAVDGAVPAISGDSALAVSLGLQSGSPLEATMTSAIRTVR